MPSCEKPILLFNLRSLSRHNRSQFEIENPFEARWGQVCDWQNPPQPRLQVSGESHFRFGGRRTRAPPVPGPPPGGWTRRQGRWDWMARHARRRTGSWRMRARAWPTQSKPVRAQRGTTSKISTGRAWSFRTCLTLLSGFDSAETIPQRQDGRMPELREGVGPLQNIWKSIWLCRNIGFLTTVAGRIWRSFACFCMDWFRFKKCTQKRRPPGSRVQKSTAASSDLPVQNRLDRLAGQYFSDPSSGPSLARDIQR